MATKKVKIAGAAETKPVAEVVGPVAVTPPTVTGVVVEPPGEAAKPVEVIEPTVVSQGMPVKEGELASAIADLAKVVDDQPKPEVKKEFVPVGVTVAEESKVGESVADKPEPVKMAKSGGKAAWVVVAFLIGLSLGMVLGYWLWGRETVTNQAMEPKQEVTKPVSPSPTVAPKVTPTPMVKVDRSKLKIQALNGSGGKGVASKAKGVLESMGYKDVAVGNADKEDYGVTEIAMKDGKMEYFETLKADLSSKYQVASQASTLAAGSTYDAVVTIGAK